MQVASKPTAPRGFRLQVETAQAVCAICPTHTDDTGPNKGTTNMATIYTATGKYIAPKCIRIEDQRNLIQDLTNAAGELHEYYGAENKRYKAACKKLDKAKAKLRAIKAEK